MTIDSMGGQEQSSWKIPVNKTDIPVGKDNHGHPERQDYSISTFEKIEAGEKYVEEIESLKDNLPTEWFNERNDSMGVELAQAIGSGMLIPTDNEFAWNFIEKYGGDKTDDFLLKKLFSPDYNETTTRVRREDKMKAWSVLKEKAQDSEEDRKKFATKVAERVGLGLTQMFPAEDTREVLTYIKENGDEDASSELAKGIFDGWADEFKDELWEILDLKGGGKTASVLATKLNDEKISYDTKKTQKIIDYIRHNGDSETAHILIEGLRKVEKRFPFDGVSRDQIWKIVASIGDNATAEELSILFDKYIGRVGGVLTMVKHPERDMAKFTAIKIKMRLAKT